MSFKEIGNLRKSGELKEAYKLAKASLQEDPDNIWNKRAMSWVQFDLLKNAIERNELQNVPKILRNIEKLNLPNDEEMLFEQLAWQIGKAVFQMKSEDVKNLLNQRKIIDEIFDIIKNFHFPKPLESYSFLYKAFHKEYKNWSRYREFAEWWNFENFLPGDYEITTLDNGRKIMSVVEQAYIAYSKSLLELNSSPFVFSKESYKELIQSFLPSLDKLIEDYPEYKYPIYYKAKLLHKIGEESEAMQTILPFARKKQNEYWIWALLSEIVTDKDEKLACLAKALQCNTKPGYLVNVRKDIAKELIGRQLFSNAKTEIELLVETKQSNGWNISNTVKIWQQGKWYIKTEANKSNKESYKKWSQAAEKILYQDVDPTTVVVEYVNKEKSIVNFIDEEKNTGFFNYSSALDKVSVGDVLDVRFDRRDNEYYTIHGAEIKKEELPHTLVKHFSDTCEIIEDKGFGFVDDIFLSPEIIEVNNIENGQLIEGRAIPSFDKKKKKWGWKAVGISREKAE